MSSIEIFSTPHCPYCQRAKALLDGKGVSYQEFDVSTDAAKLKEMLDRSQRRTVPQIFIDGQHVGGSDDLSAAERSGELDRLLEAVSKAN